MLIESRVENTTFYIDAEAASGIDKGMLVGDFHPDRCLENVVGLVGFAAQKLGEAAGQASVGVFAPSRIEIRFGVRVDGNSVTSIARVSEEAQFQVMLEWCPGR